MSTWKEKLRRVVTVEPVIFVYMTSTFIVTPAYQQMIITKVCRELLKNDTICSDPGHHKGDRGGPGESILHPDSLQRHTQFGLHSSSYTAGPGLTVLAAVGHGIAFIAILAEWGLVTGYRPDGKHKYLLDPDGCALTGLTGGHVSIFLSSFSYLADLTMGSSSIRTLRMAVAESMIFVGGMVGFLLGGFLEQEFGLKAAFGAYIGCHVLVLTYIALWLRDPMSVKIKCTAPSKEDTVEQDAQEDHSRMFIVKYAKMSFKAVFKRRPGQERLKLHFLILCTFINNLVAVGDQSILLLYLKYEPREFTTALFGVFNSARMLFFGFGLLGLFPVLMRCMKEMTLAKLSAVFRGASYVLLAFSNNTWMVFLVAVVGAPSGISQAVIRSLSSAIVGPDEQGAMFSFSASVEATCILIASSIFNGLYPLTLPTFPGMPFIVMAVFMLIVLIILQWISEMPTTQPRLVL